MKIVFDLDDTICRTINRDYANSTEISAVVSKIKEIRETLPGTEIVIHTSRGMASCNGDVEKAEHKNRPTIEKWLEEHGVEVDEIIFGKPLADIYVDDKAMTAYDFGEAKIEQYSGFSGAKVTRIGDTIIKEADNVAVQADWYREAEKHYVARKGICARVLLPKVHSVTLGRLYMDYIPGKIMARNLSPYNLSHVIDIVMSERPMPGENDLEAYAAYVEGRAQACNIKTDIGQRLRACTALKERTFCHGDLSLQNIIMCGDSVFSFIDPSPKKGMESWIMDIAKLRASLTILDWAIIGVPHSDTYLDLLDSMVERWGKDLDAVKLVEESHIIRVLYYARKLGKKEAEKRLQDYYLAKYGE